MLFRKSIRDIVIASIRLSVRLSVMLSPSKPLDRIKPNLVSGLLIQVGRARARLLYPRHTRYVGVYSFRFSVRSYVRSFVRSFVFPSQGQSFCVKVYKTSYFEDPLMDFVHIWHDGRYRSKVFISTIPTPGWPWEQGHGLRILVKKVEVFCV